MTSGLASKTCSPAHGGDVGRVAAVLVHRHDRRDPDGVGDDLVLLAETGSQVDDAGALFGGDVVGGEHLEGIGGAVHVGIGEEVEQRPVAPAGELAAARTWRPAVASPSSAA